MDLDTFRPILSGLIGAGIVYLMARAGRSPARRKGNVRVMSYGLGFRIFTVVLVPGSLFVAYAAAHARPSQILIAAIIAAAFLASAAFFAYQVFLVSFAYDDEHIYYRTPLAGSNVIPWEDVQELGYSSLVQAHYLRTAKIRRIWCSNMLRGFEELGEVLAAKGYLDRA